MCIRDRNTNKNTTDEEEDDEKFPWYNTLDDQIYFLVATHADQKVEKNQQLFYFYGSRTNKYLLSWYGFCYSNNRYDSYSFRFWMKQTDLDGFNAIKNMVYDTSLSYYEWENGTTTFNGRKISTFDLTKEIRLKKSRLNEEILVYLRGICIPKYPEKEFPETSKIVNQVTSIDYEILIVNYAACIIDHIVSRFKHSLEDDERLLENVGANPRLRFALIYRMEQQSLLRENAKMLNILLQILVQLKNGVDFKTAYLTPTYKYESGDRLEVLSNRLKLSSYLKKLNYYIGNQ
eukprot:TRINITY_DN9960_c0_g1_i12.p1 TRINITY_DN9960_c0_g1~~TRINITY_DN9960_c0_g1_i12.p1  ORF type:complete len:312 (+),score=55.34 TRINITY_DN9960_c0_g1_i12:68-937(+)